jgi:hypothetical protein
VVSLLLFPLYNIPKDIILSIFWIIVFIFIFSIFSIMVQETIVKLNDGRSYYGILTPNKSHVIFLNDKTVDGKMVFEYNPALYNVVTSPADVVNKGGKSRRRKLRKSRKKRRSSRKKF